MEHRVTLEGMVERSQREIKTLGAGGGAVVFGRCVIDSADSFPSAHMFRSMLF